MKKKRTNRHASIEATELKNRLEETEETLRAIHQDQVDALLVRRSSGARVVTLNDADFPYRMMVESMNEGAVTLISDGTIFYCNPRFSEMVQIESENLIGTPFRNLILEAEQSAFETIFAKAGRDSIRGEFCLKRIDQACRPVQLSMYQLGGDPITAISIIVTDLTERVQAEYKIRSLASQLTLAEQDERQRISQILHDDLQQRLFAIKAQLSPLNRINWSDHFAAGTYFDLDELQDSLSEAIAVTRNLSVDLSPVILQGKGVSDAMDWLASRMLEQHGLQVEIDAKESLHTLDDHLRTLLFQSVNELLFNVVKHAGTLKAKVILEEENRRTRLTISDAGKGFEVAKVMSDTRTVHGLLMIQDRLRLMGCHMEITSEPGKGTQIVIEIPRKASSS